MGKPLNTQERIRELNAELDKLADQRGAIENEIEEDNQWNMGRRSALVEVMT